MWSGPRNLSTAMMYSFAARKDCAVWDEPFYAAYLARTGLAHPMARETMAAGDVDAARVRDACLGPTPDGRAVFYQKHMVHHLAADMDKGWIGQFTNVFLIRHPARVIASYHRKHEHPSMDDIGFACQMALMDLVQAHTGEPPIVVDSADVRAKPEQMLRALCARIGLEFEPAMLQWPEGGHAQDGAWAPHWYNAVWKSTGFAAAEGVLPELPQSLQPLLAEALPIYEQMAATKIKPDLSGNF